MPIIDSFDQATEAILQPDRVITPIENFPETIVISFNQKMVEVILAACEHEQIDEIKEGHIIPIYRVTHKGKVFALCRPGIGEPVVVTALEEILAKGAKKIMLFGSCGALDKTVTAGKIVVLTHAYRDEGTSYHYMPASDYVEIPTAVRMAAILEELGVPYVNGRTWTTDAIFRETRGNMEKRRAEGCLVVEMECAGVMAMAQFRGVAAYQFVYATDNLDAAQWEPRIFGNMPHTLREQIAQIACEVAVRI